MNIRVGLAFGVLFLTQLVFGQEMNQVSFSKDAQALTSEINKGAFVLKFNPKIDAANLKKNAAYYTKYFTVLFDAPTGNASIHFVDKSPSARKIVGRFLTSNGIKEVLVGSETLSTSAFSERFLK